MYAHTAFVHKNRLTKLSTKGMQFFNLQSKILIDMRQRFEEEVLNLENQIKGIMQFSFSDECPLGLLPQTIFTSPSAETPLDGTSSENAISWLISTLKH